MKESADTAPWSETRASISPACISKIHHSGVHRVGGPPDPEDFPCVASVIHPRGLYESGVVSSASSFSTESRLSCAALFFFFFGSVIAAGLGGGWPGGETAAPWRPAEAAVRPGLAAGGVASEGSWAWPPLGVAPAAGGGGTGELWDCGEPEHSPGCSHGGGGGGAPEERSGLERARSVEAEGGGGGE